MTKTQFHQVYFNAKQLKLPLSTGILIPFDSEVRTFDEVFSKMEVKKYLKTERDPRGRIGYDPVNMLKLILFCQMENITSLRAMEKAARNDIRILWLTDELQPTHQAIKDFMDRYLIKNLEAIYYDLNQFLIQEESIDIEKLYIDGTKIEANANKYTFIWKKSLEKFRDKLYKKITKQIKALNDTYQQMDIFFPVYDIYEVDYLKRILDFLGRELEKQGTQFVYGKGQRKTVLQRDYEHIKDYHLKLLEYNDFIKTIGPNRNSCARTDHDATFMHMKEDHMRNSQLKPGYNVQIGVSDEYILHLDIYQDRNDYQTLIPFLEGYKKAYGRYPLYPVADAGYGGLMNYRYITACNMQLYQKYSMYSKDTSDKKRMNDPYFSHDLIKDKKDYIAKNGERLTYLFHNHRGNDVYQLPNGKTKEVNDENIAYQKEVIKNLTSPLGIELRTQRSIQVEGAFGVIKEAMKFRRFKRRGIQNVKFELTLIAIGYNLAKYHKKKYRILE